MAGMNPYVQSHLKDMNRLTVFRLLCNVREMSKADIARCTGISGPTVIKIINYFLEIGLVYESKESEPKPGLGRKPQLIRLNSDAGYTVGVVWEGNFLRVGITNLTGELICSKCVLLDELNIDYIIKTVLRKYINEAIEISGIDRHKILGIGVGIPAIILDREEKIIGLAPVIGINEPINLKEAFSQMETEFEAPISIDNDVNLATIGEFVFRAQNNITDMAYISLGAGLSAGLILDGKLRRGKRGSAGEISYMVFDPNYTVSKGEDGWLENKINIGAVKEKFSFSMNNIENAIKARKDDVIAFIVPMLALSVVNLSVQLDVDLIVIGGVFVEILGEDLMSALINRVKAQCVYDIEVQIQMSVDSGILGAGSLAVRENLFKLLDEEI